MKQFVISRSRRSRSYVFYVGSWIPKAQIIRKIKMTEDIDAPTGEESPCHEMRTLRQKVGAKHVPLHRNSNPCMIATNDDGFNNPT